MSSEALIRAVITSVVMAPVALTATAEPAAALPLPPPLVSTVYRVAGDGLGNLPVEGTPAVDSSLQYPQALATGPGGTIYVSTGAGMVYEVGSDGLLRRYAGKYDDYGPFSGDGPALDTMIGYVNSLATAPNGDLYIGDNGNNMVYKVDHVSKDLTRVAGTGSYDPDHNPAIVDGPALSSPVDPSNIAVDGAGNLYISSAQLAEVLKVDTNGIITRFAGLGTRNAPPQTVGGPPVVAATTAIGGVDGMVADADGNMYLMDVPNGQILKVDTNGMMTVVAGTGTANYGDPVVPGPATQAPLFMPQQLARTADGTFYVVTYSSEIYKIDNTGTLSVVSNNTAGNRPVDGAPLSESAFSHIYAAAVPADGAGDSLYVVEPTMGYVWRIALVSGPSTPGAPTGLTATALIAGADLAFTAPVATGSSPISRYQYSIDNGTTWENLTTTGTSPVTARITGMTPGWQRTLVVRAVNRSGGGVASNAVTVVPLEIPSVPAPTIVPPSEPTGLLATGGDGRLELSFQAPAMLGGAPVLRYEYTLDGTAWLPLGADAGSGTPAGVVTGLTNGTAYTVRVRAVNSAGEGVASASATGTPQGRPPAPQALTSSAKSPSIQRVDVPLAARQTVTLLNSVGSPATTVADNGVGTYRLSGRTITFTPVPGYSGTPAGVTFRVTDASGLSGTAVYTPTVTKPSTPPLPPVTPGSGGTAGSSGKQAVTGQLQPGQTIGLMAPGQVAAAQAEVTNKIPVPGEGTYQLFRSGLAFTIMFTPAPGFVGRTTGITYRISDAFGQYADATYRPTVTPAALPRIDRSRWAAVPADPKRTRGAERRTKAFNASYRGYDAYPSTALGGRVLSRNQAATLAGGTLFQGAGATLTTQGRTAVRKLVANLAAGQRITCEGYADYGLRLTAARSQAQNRARAVCDALKASGAEVTTTVTGYGSRRPAVIGGTIKSRTENQRVVVVVTG